MQDLNDLYYFAKVVEAGGFAAAGRLLGIPKSRLSRRVAELEERLGARLLQRTCRDKNRPLLQVENPEKKLRDLLTVRDPLYREVADFIIETNQGAASDLAQKIFNLIVSHIEQK